MASETFADGEGSWRNATASEGAAAKLTGRDEPDPMDCPRGSPDRMERRQATWPRRYNHLHLGGPVRRRQSQIHLNSSRNATPAANLRELQHFNRGGRPRRRGFSPRPRSPASHATSQSDVARSRCRLTRPPKHNAPGHDLDPRRRFPTRAPAHEDPLPLGPANVPVFSGEGQRERAARPAAFVRLQHLVGRRPRRHARRQRLGGAQGTPR